jgi:hypothetical protein
MIDLVDSLAITIGFVVILVVLLGPSIYSGYQNRKLRRSLDPTDSTIDGKANGAPPEGEKRSPS